MPPPCTTASILPSLSSRPRLGAIYLSLGECHLTRAFTSRIDVANRAGVPLILAGIIPPENEAYFRDEVEPRLGPNVRFVGPVDMSQKSRLYSGALAFLHLVTYDEAFGLTMVEAMACGCPVIAFRRGSVPEVVADTENRFHNE